MNKVLTVITLLFVVVTISLSGCLGKEPIIPDDDAKKIILNLGYALAPAWLPDGYEYIGPFPDNISPFFGKTIRLSYSKYGSATSEDSLFMIYPAEGIIPSSFSSAFQEMADLTPPEDAITEIEINATTAYFYQGGWSEETLGRITKLEEPIDPEWDYESNISIRFTIDVPRKGNIWVNIGTIFSVDDITQKDLVKIARSVIVIE